MKVKLLVVEYQKEYIPGVEKGIKLSTETGFLAGFPVIDFKCTLVDGAYHDVDSSVMAFEIAARAAFREAMAKAKAVLTGTNDED